MEPSATHGHVLPYHTVILVWLLLLGLTAVLVLATRLSHEALSVPAMLTVTPFKAGLVFYYFMHLKWEKPFLKSMVFLALALLTVSIALIFLDLSYR